MLIAFLSFAKDNIATSDRNMLQSTLAKNVMTLPAKGPKLNLPRYRGDGGGGAHFFLGVELGYSSGKMVVKDTVTKGGGFMYGGELGAKIEMPCRNPNRVNLLSISAAFMVAPMAKARLGFVTLPISYTSMGMGGDGEGKGFYWQAGINVRYLSEASVSDKDAKAGFNRVFVDPCIGFGLSAPFHLMGRNSGEIGGGRVQFGPSFSYSVMNLVKTGDMHGFMIGVRYQYIFM